MASDTLQLYYEERAPYMMRHIDALQGVEGAPVVEALNRAQIPYVLREAPIARQLALIDKSELPSCAVGLYKTPEREKIGKFTQAIYHAMPQDLVVRRDNAKLDGIDSLSALFATAKVRLVVRNGYSYGATLDAMMAHAQAQIMRPPEDSAGRLRMVMTGMVDGAFFTGEEAEVLIRNLGMAGRILEMRRFPDTPPGADRYLLCSKRLDDQVFERLNAAIATLHN